MKIINLWFTQVEFDALMKYYFGCSRVYEFCYENSEQFKTFVDKSDERRSEKIKALMHSVVNEPKNLEGELNSIISSKEFKNLFSRFDEVLLINGIEW